MRPVIARRITTCYYCKDSIVKGSERLTDYIRVKNNQSESGWSIIRRHFHFRKDGEENGNRSCHDRWVVEIFSRMPPYVPRSNNPKGRPSLDLTNQQKLTRRFLLKRLAAQVRYYIQEGNLDLSKPQYLIEVTLKSVRKATRFRDNLNDILKGLEQVGGIPKRYEGYIENSKEGEEQVA